MERQIITVDIAPGNSQVERLGSSQGDIGRPMGVYIIQNGVALDCSAYSAELYILKPDGKFYTTQATVDSTETNLIKWDTALQETPVAGACAAQIRIASGDDDIGTARFVEFVEASPGDMGSASESEVALLTEYVRQARESATSAGRDATTASDAASSASGSASTATTAANTATQAASAATAAADRAEAVEESIPEDYSQLSDDVTELKSALKVSTRNCMASLIMGDVTAPYAVFNTTNKTLSFPSNALLISPTDPYTYYSLSNKTASYSSVNNSAKKIYYRTSTSDFYVTAYSNAPATGDILIAVLRDAGANTTVEINCPYMIDGNMYGMYAPDYEPYNTNLYSVSSTVPGYLDTSGVLSSPTDAKERTTPYIPVVAGKKITISYNPTLETGQTPAIFYCFYDASKTLVGSRHGAQVTVPFSWQGVEIPSDVAYIRIAARYFDVSNPNISFTYTSKNVPYIPNPGDNNMDILATLQTAVDTDAQQKARYNHVVKEAVHRGLYGYPENTLIAFKAARKAGYAYIETDVQCTSDGVYVLLHDPTINRTARNTDGTALSETVYIDRITYTEALTYDFGIYKGSQFAGTKIPTLIQLLEMCRKIDLDICLEVKNEDHGMTQAQVEGVVDLVNRYGMKGHVICESSSGQYFVWLATKAPEQKAALIFNSLTDRLLEWLAMGKAVNENIIAAINYSYIDSSTVTTISGLGYELMAWTPNNANTILALDPYITWVVTEQINANDILYADGMEE